MNFLTKLAQYEPSEMEQFQDALSELSQDQLDDFQRSVAASPRLDKLAFDIAQADRIGREMAHEQGEMLKQAALPASVASFAQKATGMALRNPGAAMAAGGGALGVASGLVAPGRDPQTGQQKSRLGSALTRGAIVAGAGYGISKIPVGGGGNVGSWARKAVVGNKPMFGAAAQTYGRDAIKATTPVADKATLKASRKLVKGNEKNIADRTARGISPGEIDPKAHAAALGTKIDPGMTLGAKGQAVPGRVNAKGMMVRAKKVRGGAATPAAGAAPAAPVAPPVPTGPTGPTTGGPVAPPAAAPATPAATPNKRIRKPKVPATAGAPVAAPAAPAAPSIPLGPTGPTMGGPQGKKKLASMSMVERMKYVISSR